MMQVITQEIVDQSMDAEHSNDGVERVVEEMCTSLNVAIDVYNATTNESEDPLE